MKPKGFKSAKTMDKLIAAVQARECLWDKSYRGHRNRFKLERYWNEVAAEVGTTSVNCRKKWKNLKDQCRKEIKRNQMESDWPHFQKLKFIHNQFLTEDDENEGECEASEGVYSGLDESIKQPKLGYTIRKKFLVNKRRTIDLNQHKLIELVQARDIIWNRQLKGHHNWYKLDEAWKEIAQELNVTRDEARLKWKYIRDQARKECRKGDSEWDLLPRLQFIINQFNDFEGNENENDHDFNDSQDFSQDVPDPDDPTYYTEPPIPTTAKAPEEFDEFDTKPVIMETDFYDDDDEVQKTSDSVEPAKDEDVGFFNSLMPHIKKLGPAKKLMLRMKIQELVYNTVYN